MHDVLILGGYGNFGKRIAAGLARHGVPIIIAGRDANKAEELAARLRTQGGVATSAAFDVEKELESRLLALKPGVVVNTCGPFQGKNYAVAEACIRQKVHYIDLADGRDFVIGITRLDEVAKAAEVSVISGASTVPGLSSAVVERYRGEFSSIDALVYGISPGAKAERGLATTQGILTYVGKPLKAMAGDAHPRYGWGDLYRQEYPGLGQRWMANCDIPDLDLFPARYGIGTIRFSAGMESGLLHLGIFALSLLVRLGLPLDLPRHAAFLLRASRWFDRFGGDAGGMHVIIRGTGVDGSRRERRWFIMARNGDGPQIPCVPAIVLASRLAGGAGPAPGAYPCLGLVSLEDYLRELAPYAMETVEK